MRTGRRPSGGVSITDMSRSPASDICSVRGIGVADIEITSTCSRSWRALLLLDAEALLLVDDQQAEILGAHVAGEQPVGADQDVHATVVEPLERLALLGRAAEARHGSTVKG